MKLTTEEWIDWQKRYEKLEQENKQLKEYIKEKDLYILSHPHELKEIVEKIKQDLKETEEYFLETKDDVKRRILDYHRVMIQSILTTKEGKSNP